MYIKTRNTVISHIIVCANADTSLTKRQ